LLVAIDPGQRAAAFGQTEAAALLQVDASLAAAFLVERGTVRVGLRQVVVARNRTSANGCYLRYRHHTKNGCSAVVPIILPPMWRLRIGASGQTSPQPRSTPAVHQDPILIATRAGPLMAKSQAEIRTITAPAPSWGATPMSKVRSCSKRRSRRFSTMYL
jgi:hypothetical protein